MKQEKWQNFFSKRMRRFALFLTGSLVFLILFACSALFAAENSRGTDGNRGRNPNDTHFARTLSGKSARELFQEGVYQRFSDENTVTYLVLMHKKGDLAGDSFERTYIGIESVQRESEYTREGSVFMAARLRSPKEIKLSGLQSGPLPANDNEIPFLLDYAETARDGKTGVMKNQSKLYLMSPAPDGRINIIGAEGLPAPLCGHYIPVTDRPAPLVLQQAMIKCMLEDFIPAATNMLSVSQFYDYSMEFKTGDNPPVDTWAGWYQVTVREDEHMNEYDPRYQMNFIVGDTGNEIKLLTLYDGKMWPVFEDERLKSTAYRESGTVPKG